MIYIYVQESILISENMVDQANIPKPLIHSPIHNNYAFVYVSRDLRLRLCLFAGNLRD